MTDSIQNKNTSHPLRIWYFSIEYERSNVGQNYRGNNGHFILTFTCIFYIGTNNNEWLLYTYCVYTL